MKCTWIDCKEEAIREQRDEQGKIWANLCESHDREISEGIAKGDAARVVTGWIKAHGSKERWVNRMMGRDI